MSKGPGFEVDFAVTAVAACAAFFAEVVGTGVLGATNANAGGLFLANAADKRHGCGHQGFRFVPADAAGWRERVARQRCAS